MRASVLVASFAFAFAAAAFAQSFWQLRHPVFYDLAGRTSLVPSTGLEWTTSFTAATLAAGAASWVTGSKSRTRRHR